MKRAKNSILLYASLASFAIVSACLFAMYFIESDSGSGVSPSALISGAVFWIFLIAGTVLQIIVSKNVKRWYKQSGISRSESKKKRIGLISIFSNKPAIISDAVLFASLIAFIAFAFINSAGIMVYISLSLLSLSFSAHCILNGKNYYYITNYEQIKAQLRK